jgi:hypothetical protein
LPLSGLVIVVPSARYWRTACTNLDQTSQRAANSDASACFSMSARLPHVTSAGRRERNLSAATKRTSKIAFDVLSGKGI